MEGDLALGQGTAEGGGSDFERTSEGTVHNTAPVFSPDGEPLARYRRLCPWQPHEQAESGDRLTVFEIPGIGRIGLAVCYDGSFPETVRQLAWLGAEVTIQPTRIATA
ncbi:carbon-nitrogen hydrolase family protein [Kitasatospora cineracea]|uniref:carbon-nitrogen hydrolase family protein n=1 Tax=Kitasatospora cineracea TaxID=88074 RepID=UPI001FC8F185|nr:carbon-nitrogen hydrolase family protein [Kitasatospora cineracea]